MKRVIIFSDSLGRPRPDLSVTDRTVYSDVYGKKLEQLLGAEYDVEICYVESLDTDDGIFWAERMVAFREPDIVVFQIGINDCAPRIFSKKSSCIILKPWFRKLTHDFFLRVIGFFRPHITRCMKKVYVHVNKYKTNYKIIGNKFSKTLGKKNHQLPESLTRNLLKQEKILKNNLNLEKLRQNINKIIRNGQMNLIQ